MVRFGFIEDFEGFDLRHDGGIPNVRSVEFHNDCFSGFFLVKGMVQDDRSVLRTHVSTLSIPRGGIMRREENVQDLLKGDLGRVESDLDDFRVACRPSGDLLIGWICEVAPRVSRYNSFHAIYFFEHRFCAPEAATPQRRNFLSSRTRRVGW